MHGQWIYTDSSVEQQHNEDEPWEPGPVGEISIVDPCDESKLAFFNLNLGYGGG